MAVDDEDTTISSERKKKKKEKGSSKSTTERQHGMSKHRSKSDRKLSSKNDSKHSGKSVSSKDDHRRGKHVSSDEKSKKKKKKKRDGSQRSRRTHGSSDEESSGVGIIFDMDDELLREDERSNRLSRSNSVASQEKMIVSRTPGTKHDGDRERLKVQRTYSNSSSHSRNKEASLPSVSNNLLLQMQDTYKNGMLAAFQNRHKQEESLKEDEDPILIPESGAGTATTKPETTKPKMNLNFQDAGDGSNPFVNNQAGNQQEVQSQKGEDEPSSVVSKITSLLSQAPGDGSNPFVTASTPAATPTAEDTTANNINAFAASRPLPTKLEESGDGSNPFVTRAAPDVGVEEKVNDSSNPFVNPEDIKVPEQNNSKGNWLLEENHTPYVRPMVDTTRKEDIAFEQMQLTLGDRLAAGEELTREKALELTIEKMSARLEGFEDERAVYKNKIEQLLALVAQQDQKIKALEYYFRKIEDNGGDKDGVIPGFPKADKNDKDKDSNNSPRHKKRDIVDHLYEHRPPVDYEFEERGDTRLSTSFQKAGEKLRRAKAEAAAAAAGDHEYFD